MGVDAVPVNCFDEGTVGSDKSVSLRQRHSEIKAIAHGVRECKGQRLGAIDMIAYRQ